MSSIIIILNPQQQHQQREKKIHLAIHTTFDDRLKNLFIKTTKIDGCWWTQKQNSLQDLND